MKLDQHIKEIGDKILEQEMKNLPDRIRRVIEGAISSLLGLEKKYDGKYEVDHCNSRWNLFSEVLQAEAKSDVVKIVKELKLKLSIADFKDAFQTEYRSYFRAAMKYEAQAAAKERVNAYVKNHLDKYVSEIASKELKVDKT